MTLLRNGCVLLALHLTAGPGRGQFEPCRREQTDMVFHDTRDMAVADLDRDGDRDVVLARWTQPPLILYNDRGVLRSQTLDSRSLPATSVTVGDVNGDRIPDICLGTWHAPPVHTGQAELYVGLAAGGFRNVTAATLPRDFFLTQAVQLADLDGDKDLDLVLANVGQRNRIYINTAGKYSDQTSTRLPPIVRQTNAVAVVDIDGDKDLDLLMANGWVNFGEQNGIYLNDGRGRFTDATSKLLPLSKAWTRSVAVGDVNGDGRLDIVFGNAHPGGAAYPDTLLLGQQNGFVDASSTRLPRDSRATNDLVLHDVNGDSFLDLVGAGDSKESLYSRLWVSSSWVYLNDGKGLFKKRTAPGFTPTPYARSIRVRPLHIDGDGKIDLVVANRGDLGLYFGDGKGKFSSVTQVTLIPNLVTVLRDTAVGDLNRDGELDMLLGTEGQNLLFFGGLHGTYTNESQRLPAAQEPTTSVTFWDLDRDKDLDILIGNEGKVPNRIYLNSGRGQFADATSMLPSAVHDTMAMVVVDVDGDGKDDIVEANAVRDGLRLYRNNGKGKYVDESATRLPPLSGDTASLLAIDVDGDGDQDLMLGNGIPTRWGGGRQDALLVNDGTGRFVDETSKRMPVDRIHATTSLSSADIDGDGDMDVMRGVWNEDFLGVRTKLMVNDGTGRFKFDLKRFVSGLLYQWIESVQFADVDGNGSPDIVSPFSVVYLNNGRGYFREVWGQPRWGRMGAPIASGDFDGDGDTDLVLSTTLFSNQTIGLRIPTWPLVGGRLRVDMGQWPWSHAPGPGIGLLYMQVGGTGTRQSVGYPGLLRLDPRRLVLSGVHAVGKSTPADFPVPNDVRLRGTRVGVQALMWNPRSRWQLGLTNVDWTSIR